MRLLPAVAFALLFVSAAALAGGPFGSRGGDNRRLDIRVYPTPEGLVLKRPAGQVAEDCTIAVNGDFLLKVRRLARGASRLPWTDFADAEGAALDVETVRIDWILVRCISPAFRQRSFRRLSAIFD